MAQHIETGKKGEAIAQSFLLQKGFKILHVNWRHSRCEVDIVAEKINRIHFIEVKALSKSYQFPEDKVDAKKQDMLAIAAEAYIEQFDVKGELQFDIIAVDLGKEQSIHFIEDAFYPLGE